MKTEIYDIIIIGAGPAGLASALYSKRAGMKTLVIEKMVAGGQINLSHAIANYPGVEEMSGVDLAMKMYDQVEKLGVEFIFDEIVSVDLENKIVTMHDCVYRCGAIIIATGAGPRKMGAKFEEKFLSKGVHYCALCDANFYKGKDVIMVGGGNSAVEDSIYLAAICKSVTIVNLTQELNAQGVLIKSLKEQPNITAIYNESAIDELLGDTKITGAIIKDLKTGNMKEVQCDGIFVAIGRVPNIDLFHRGLEFGKGGYIKTNERCETNMAGVFAAGDVREKHYRQVVTAVADGAISGSAASEYVRINAKRADKAK